MKFGKLSDISNVQFGLPADALGNQAYFQSLPKAESLQFYFGCTGWSMKEWIGKVYPKGTKSKDYLSIYSRQFNTIELNTTHYRSPAPELIQKWLDESPDSFRFCPKVLQRISHSKDLGASNPIFKIFTESIGLLGDRLGACFMQLPPYFGSDRMAMLEDFFKRWPTYLPLGIELRHDSWFQDDETLNRLSDLLRKYHKGFVITDVAGRRDVLHMSVTAPYTMVRFVGNSLVPSDYERIDEWINRIDDWHKQGLESVYFFPHEPDNLLAPDLSAYLAEQVSKRFDLDLPEPNLNGSWTDSNSDQQMSLF